MLIWVDGTHWVEAEVLAPAQGRTMMAAPQPLRGSPSGPVPHALGVLGLDYFLSLLSAVLGEHSCV